MQIRRSRSGRYLVAGVATALLGAGLAACGSNDDDGSSGPATNPAAASAGALAGKTISVALIAYYPFCDLKNGRAIGFEPEMLDSIAKREGFKVNYKLVDFSGQLAGVQAGRYDLALCDFYWTKDRVGRGIFTDPIAYTPVQVVQKEGSNINTVKGFENKHLGSITGYSWNPALKDVPGANVRLFPDPPGLLADIAAGRVQVAPADPLVTQAAIKKQPSWNLHVSDLVPPTPEELAAHPNYKLLRPSQIAWYASKKQQALADELSKAIDKMYTDGTLAGLLTKNGGSADWLKPPGDYIAEQRRGVDRPADWQPPSSS